LEKTQNQQRIAASNYCLFDRYAQEQFIRDSGVSSIVAPLRVNCSKVAALAASI